MTGYLTKFRQLSMMLRGAIAFGALAFVFGAVLLISRGDRSGAATDPGLTNQARRDNTFQPTASQWAALTIRPVERHAFRSEFPTEGKIAIDENLATRIFSPYAGRVTKLLAAPGDAVVQGQTVFVIEAADSVDAQKDFVAALGESNKARSQVNLASIIERRLGSLYKEKAMALKDWEEAQANLTTAQNNLRSSEVALQAVRNRLRLLGKTGAEIDTFEKTGVITPEAPVHAPLSGTILQRKMGPGQYVNAGASDSDPVLLIGDISKVWLVAYVRESDVAKVQLGQGLKFTVLSRPDRSFEGTIDYIAPSIDASSRRLMVRATIDNSGGMFKPEMFASVTVLTDEGGPSPAVPREAIIYEGDRTRVWIASDERVIELRQVKLGISNGRLVQVLDGLKSGEKVITQGSLFIDRIATAGQS